LAQSTLSFASFANHRSPISASTSTTLGDN
jgi:hypothetical protein